eukprot:2578694-Pyramimonas_sp.AAC.1
MREDAPSALGSPGDFRIRRPCPITNRKDRGLRPRAFCKGSEDTPTRASQERWRIYPGLSNGAPE